MSVSLINIGSLYVNNLSIKCIVYVYEPTFISLLFKKIKCEEKCKLSTTLEFIECNILVRKANEIMSLFNITHTLS